MTLNDDDMDTFVFAVGTKKSMARLQKEMQDLVNIVQCVPGAARGGFSDAAVLVVTHRASSAGTSRSPGPSTGSQNLWRF